MSQNEVRLSASIASGRGTKFEVPPSDSDKLCLMTDGTLYVASSYSRDMSVLSYQELLRRNGINFKVQLASVDEIQRMYVSVSQANDGDSSIRQEQVIRILKMAVDRRASDIHIRNFAKHTEIWMRIDGFLQLDKKDVLKSEDGGAICGTIYRSMCDEADSDYVVSRAQDARIKAEFANKAGLVSARVATTPTDQGNLMVIRLLYRNARYSLIDMGYMSQQNDVLRRMTKRTHGVNIFSGATGSGKSTSLEVLLSELLAYTQYKINVLTIENPPEYVIAGAVQTSIKCDSKDHEALAREWARSISRSLRLDPDVMMVGEIRDKDSAIAAFKLAMTGHGVWATLHANDAVAILDRLKSEGVDLDIVTDASTVTGLINQSLVPKNCESCKRPYLRHKHEVEPDLRERIEMHCDVEKVFLKGNDRGCPHCGGRGYHGRTVVAECVVPTQSFMNVYKREGKAAARAYWVGQMRGITKNQHLIHKVNEGMVDPLLGEQSVCPLDEDHITLG